MNFSLDFVNKIQKGTVKNLKLFGNKSLLANKRIVNYEPCTDCIRQKNGVGAGSQGYMPWNSISATWAYSNDRITAFSSGFTGLTLGIGWNQGNWQQIGGRNSDGSFTVQVTYQTTYTLFVEGVGTVFTSVWKTAEFNIGSGSGYFYVYYPQN
jgi:hypothetical protein